MKPQRLFPVSLAEIHSWAKSNGLTQDEARRRFVQFVIIESLARGLPGRLSFKGGNALRFCFHNPRGTTDIDYTALSGIEDDPGIIRHVIDSAMRDHSGDYGIACKVQSVHRNPPGPGATMPTYHISVGWTLPGFRDFPDFLKSSEPSSAVIPVEISINDVVCETNDVSLDVESHVIVTVCALEDIVAEKLRALLQQVSRNRTRPQDVYDVARMVRTKSLNEAKVAKYFVAKSSARNIVPNKSSFANQEVRARAEVDYEVRIGSTGADFISFETAWAEVLALVERLNIPP